MMVHELIVFDDTSSISVYFTGYIGGWAIPLSEIIERAKLTELVESVTSIVGVMLHLFFGNT